MLFVVVVVVDKYKGFCLRQWMCLWVVGVLVMALVVVAAVEVER